MGKQIQIFASAIDEIRFGNFLKQNFRIKFFQSFAESQEDIIIEQIPKTYYPYSSVYIWNEDFDWEPEFSTTITKEKLFYIKNNEITPLLQYSKSNLEEKIHGRLYWAKNFAGEPDYDLEEFNIFYSEVTKWIRKNAKGKIMIDRVNIYCMEDAWEKISKSGVEKNL